MSLLIEVEGAAAGFAAATAEAGHGLEPWGLGALGFSRLRLHCIAKDHVDFATYAGGAVRGVLGLRLYQLVCVARSTPCGECPLAPRCAFFALFETRHLGTPNALPTMTDLPRPFVIEPPTTLRVEPGASFEFGITLIGRAVEHAPWVLQAFANAGEVGIGRGRGKYELLRAVSTATLEVVVEGGRLLRQAPTESLSGLPLRRIPERTRLTFLTPLRLKSNGKLTLEPTFELVARHLARRVTHLALLHCGLRPEETLRSAVSACRHVRTERSDLCWFDWTRRSTSQQALMRLGGLTGEMFCTGIPQDVAPLLALGEHVHVGKGATFGLGLYRVGWADDGQVASHVATGGL